MPAVIFFYKVGYDVNFIYIAWSYLFISHALISLSMHDETLPKDLIAKYIHKLL